MCDGREAAVDLCAYCEEAGLAVTPRSLGNRRPVCLERGLAVLRGIVYAQVLDLVN